jgi:hypothetical protein
MSTTSSLPGDHPELDWSEDGCEGGVVLTLLLLSKCSVFIVGKKVTKAHFKPANLKIPATKYDRRSYFFLTVLACAKITIYSRHPAKYTAERTDS